MSLRVLVVDDNRDTSDSLALVLRLHGYSVRQSYSGKDAIAASVEFRPHVLIVDIAMPGMTGIELVRTLWQRTDVPQAVVIAITGLLHYPDFPEACLCLPKPVDPQRVLDILIGLSEGLEEK
jgi:CheY-like chemotaxis protein